jgi:hypothetical protein
MTYSSSLLQKQTSTTRLYGLFMWVERSYKQVKQALDWAEYQVRSDMAIRRHCPLVWCAFSFSWRHLGQGAWEAPPGWQQDREAPVREAGQPEEGAWRGKKSAKSGSAAVRRMLAGNAAQGTSTVGAVAYARSVLVGVVAVAPAS